MTRQEKVFAGATMYSIAAGVVITLLIWSRIAFDANQVVPVATLILLCFFLAGAQAIGPAPIHDLEFLIGPRQLLTPLLGAVLMWLFYRSGVDYSGVAAGILREPKDGHITLGIFAGWCAAEVWVVAAIMLRDSNKF